MAPFRLEEMRGQLIEGELYVSVFDVIAWLDEIEDSFTEAAKDKEKFPNPLSRSLLRDRSLGIRQISSELAKIVVAMRPK